MFKWLARAFWSADRIEAEIVLFLASNQNSSGAMIANGLKISSGKLYPALLRLEVRGFISSRWEDSLVYPRRRIYRTNHVNL